MARVSPCPCRSEIAGPIAVAVLKVAAVALAGSSWPGAASCTRSAVDLSTLIVEVTVPCLTFANAAGGLSGFSPASAL